MIVRIVVSKLHVESDLQVRFIVAVSDVKVFERFQIDMFEIDAVDLMNVTRVIVGHDSKQEGCGWFLHRVCVRVANSDSADSYWMFPCDR